MRSRMVWLLLSLGLGCGPNELARGGVDEAAPEGSVASAVDFRGRFAERELLRLDTPAKLYGSFLGDHRAVVAGTSVPAGVTFSGETLVFQTKAGLVVQNPAAGLSFYKVEVVLADEGQSSLTSYLTLLDNLWAAGVSTQGVSVGLDTSRGPSTYWYEHTQLSRATAEQQEEARTRLSRFVRRRGGDVKLELYVTPAGTYAVVDGANFGSLPNLRMGSYVFRPTTPMRYVVVGKYDTAQPAQRAVLKSLRVVALDDSVATVEEVNAYFIKRTVESGAFAQLVSEAISSNGTGGFQNALWAAFLYRGYDHYFAADHLPQVRQLADVYLKGLAAYVDQQLPRYGRDPTLQINHSFINSIQWNPVGFYAISDYLRADQRERGRVQFARVLDTAQAHLKADGSFPAATGYVGDTFAEEVSWLIQFHSGYLAGYPNDFEQGRAARTRQYLTWLGFHHLSTGSSIQAVYGTSLGLDLLPPGFQTFSSRYMWDDGAIDNHDFHPSAGYAGGAVASSAAMDGLLRKRGIVIPTLRRNLDLGYERSVRRNVDVTTLKLSQELPRWVGGSLQVMSDHYAFAGDGSVSDFVGMTSPSRVEDWSVEYTGYSIPEQYGDYATATTHARTVYQRYYSGAGKLFCGHTPGSGCSIGATNLYNFLFGDALYSMLNSPRSAFTPSFRRACEEDLGNENVWVGGLDWACDSLVRVAGQSSVRLSSAGASNAEAYSSLRRVVPGSRVRLAYQVKTSALAPTTAGVYGRMVLAQYGALAREDHHLLHHRLTSGFELASPNVGGTAEWSARSVDVGLRPDASFVRLRAPLALMGEASGTVWFDAVSLQTLCGGLPPGAVLLRGQAMSACNGRYHLIHQTDGNVVLYNSAWQPLWHSSTYGRATERLVMQGDGNLVLYAPGGAALWHSHTWGHPGAVLEVRDDGNLVLAQVAGAPLWATGTAGR